MLYISPLSQCMLRSRLRAQTIPRYFFPKTFCAILPPVLPGCPFCPPCTVDANVAYIEYWSRGDWCIVEKAWGAEGPVGKKEVVGEADEVV